MFLEQRPIEPTGFVVLAVCIVVADLGAPDLITHHEHREPKRQQCGGQEILRLAVSEFFNGRIIGRSLYAAVPASIIICTVAISFPVGFVVLLVIGNEVIERKSVMTGYEVDALFRLALLVTVNFRASN